MCCYGIEKRKFRHVIICLPHLLNIFQPYFSSRFSTRTSIRHFLAIIFHSPCFRLRINFSSYLKPVLGKMAKKLVGCHVYIQSKSRLSLNDIWRVFVTKLLLSVNAKDIGEEGSLIERQRHGSNKRVIMFAPPRRR